MENNNREPISAFVICFNEEDRIRDCLKSLDFCDEVIAIDSFSTDRTVEIAKELGVQVIQRKWTGYRDQKAYGLTLMKNQWVINIDADERVSEELKENILNVLKEIKEDCVDRKNINGYYVNRVVFYLGRWWRKGGWYPEYRLRFFRKDKVTWGGVEPHEKPIVEGDTAIIQGELQHFTYKNMDEQVDRRHKVSTMYGMEDWKKSHK